MNALLYELRRDSLRQPLEGHSTLEIECALCPKCGERYCSGPVTATLTADDLPNAYKQYKKSKSWDSIKEIEKHLHLSHKLLGLFLPGASLGPWIFKRQSNELWRNVDCLWGDPGGMLWKPELTGKVMAAGFDIRFASVTVAGENKNKEERHHIDAPVFDVLHPKTYGQDPWCSVCGGIKVLDPFDKTPTIFWIDKKKAEFLPPIFTVLSFESCILLRPDFGKFLSNLAPSGMKFHPQGGFL